MHICRGSASEIDTQLEVAARLGYVSPEQKGGLDEKLDKISKMLSGLIRSVRTRDS
ncbi:four helix bundle protein [Candidatus Bipolaricaulota bacterium]|nr:four helix bundle protein [Candidatus Bipolaricaulota bacterium]